MPLPDDLPLVEESAADEELDEPDLDLDFDPDFESDSDSDLLSEELPFLERDPEP